MAKQKEKLSFEGIDDVIIIDDDPGVTEVLDMYCENLGVFRNIISAADGSIASKKLHNQRFLLVFLDINMPKKSGIDIIHELAHNDFNFAESVIIVSGSLDKDVLNHSMRSGVKNFLVKPFSEEQFSAKVKEVLSKIRPDLSKDIMI